MSEQTAAQPESEPLPHEGDVLAGKYRVERLLGRGGMGFVVAAEHTTLRQKVAVKMLLPEAAKREDATERFLREARAAVAIKSEHVARVMDVGTLDSGEPFMVMELLAGSDLGAVVQQRKTLPAAEAVDYILQACEAIAEAHAIGIIHRDLKPANLFLTARADGSPLVKVLDFGLSKVTGPNAFEASLTQANTIMGSPFYMSPEQVRSLKGLDKRSDIWSLGVILYQLLAGVRPFEAEALAELFLKIGAEPAPRLATHRPDLPAESRGRRDALPGEGRGRAPAVGGRAGAEHRALRGAGEPHLGGADPARARG
ncbi:MAG: serine/threonine-protein kinase [Minicystis sp.]